MKQIPITGILYSLSAYKGDTMNRQSQLRHLLADANYFSRQIGKGDTSLENENSFVTAVNKLKLFCRLYKISINTFQMPATTLNNAYTVFTADPEDIKYNF